jgi:cyclopropane-fatty-acyl-phospholipid synthase
MIQRGRPSYAVKTLLSAMENTAHGRVALRLPDGTRREFGEGDLVCEGRINNWRALDTVMSRGDIGFAEAYIDGSFEADRPDQLIVWACRNERQLRKAIYGAAFSLVLERIKHKLRRNTIEGSRKNISSHYDLGNEFYGLWLDRTLTYSSALYLSGNESLEAAQEAKYERILQQAGTKQGDHILEIGCGWGGFFSYAVQSRDCQVTAVTISQKQYDACRARVEREGLTQNVNVLLEDYRKIDGKFDQIVSIEMIEAVGRSYWATYFQKVRASLNDKGKAVIQAITIREDLFDKYANGTDFIQQYVFPGGQLPTPSAVSQIGSKAGLNLINLYSLADSYEKTLHVWREKFTETREDVLKLGFNQEFMRLWDFYLAYCEGAFRIGRVGVSHFTLQPLPA